MPTAEQLLLNLRPRPDARLSDFAAPAFADLLAAVAAFLESPGSLLYIQGARGQGRSHLLAALCSEAERQGRSALLLPLAELRDESSELLVGLETHSVVACDDVDAIAGSAAWEEGLFHLFNRVRAAGGGMVFSAGGPPGLLGLGLPDLVSRLSQASRWVLALPDDASRQALLEAAASRRDLVMEPEVMRYLLVRGPREPGRLLALLAELDRQSLVAGRRLTVPFVRHVLEGHSPQAEGAR